MFPAMTVGSLLNLDPKRFESRPILKKLAAAGRQLAELKGVAASIPNQAILINTLGLQEAKDSSAIENIVTTSNNSSNETTPGFGAFRERRSKMPPARSSTHRRKTTTRSSR